MAVSWAGIGLCPVGLLMTARLKIFDEPLGVLVTEVLLDLEAVAVVVLAVSDPGPALIGTGI